MGFSKDYTERGRELRQMRESEQSAASAQECKEGRLLPWRNVTSSQSLTGERRTTREVYSGDRVGKTDANEMRVESRREGKETEMRERLV